MNHRSDIPSDIPFRRTLDNPLPTCLRMYMASHHYLIRANTLVFTSYRKKTQSVMWVPRPAFCINPAGGETRSPRVRHTSDIPPTYPGPHCRLNDQFAQWPHSTEVRPTVHVSDILPTYLRHTLGPSVGSKPDLLKGLIERSHYSKLPGEFYLAPPQSRFWRDSFARKHR